MAGSVAVSTRPPLLRSIYPVLLLPDEELTIFSARADQYSSNGCASRFKALILCKVAAGNMAKCVTEAPTLTRSPPGFDSVSRDELDCISSPESNVHSDPCRAGWFRGRRRARRVSERGHQARLSRYLRTRHVVQHNGIYVIIRIRIPASNDLGTERNTTAPGLLERLDTWT